MKIDVIFYILPPVLRMYHLSLKLLSQIHYNMDFKMIMRDIYRAITDASGDGSILN